ncbi:MAG: hypothetical protein E8D47_02970 [Nitrospira sp.]|nr:MAG: hypothetical protein E8D47_02970 [Nitrospira sp.]
MKIGWKEKSVGEILQLEYGKPLDDSDRKPNGLFPVYGANGEKDRTDKFYHDKPSIIVGRKGSAGEINLTENKFWPLDVTYFVTFDEQKHALRFLYYLLTTLDLTKLAKGVKPGINRNEVYSQITRVPSLTEQQRIVGILDEAFEDIATATAKAEKNLQNARALFESHLQSVFTQRGKGWVNFSLVSACDLFVDSAHRTPKYQDDGIPALRPRDVVNGRLNLEGALRVCEEEYEIQSKRYKPKPGDIVYSRELSYGWAALLPKSPRVCLSQGMCLFRPSSRLDASFLLYMLNGSMGREQATRAAVGAAHPHINLGDIKSYLIPTPSLETQQQITKQLNAFREETQRLESLCQQKLAALDELKKSLLHQAFTGEL